jgi:hypothetical protein
VSALHEQRDLETAARALGLATPMPATPTALPRQPHPARQPHPLIEESAR